MTAHDINSVLRDLAPTLANHLWQSTAIVAAAGLLTLVLRSNRAHTRHWIWMAASLKFLLPFALLAGIAGHFARPRVVAAPAAPAVYSAVEDFSEPFAAQFAATVVMRPHRSVGDWLPIACAAVWLAGFVVALMVWTVRWRRVACMVRSGEPMPEGREVAILRRLQQAGGVRRPMRLVLSDSAMEPGVFGVVRPVLAWPAGISQRLDDAHLETVLAHEVCHVRRWDNLTAMLHMSVEAAFWFHPLVWWMGARLVAERERACDEEVLQLLNRPQVYAESILKVCEFCVESPLECVAGVTGADLKKRIVEIMRARAVLRLTWGKKLLIGAAIVCAIAVPVVLGQARAAQRLMLAAIKVAPKPIQTAARAMLTEGQPPAGGEIAASTQNSANREQPSAGPVIASASSPQFDAASVKPSDASNSHRGFNGSPGGRVFFGGPARMLVQYAYGLQDYQVKGGPDWAASEPFVINAIPPDDSPSRNITVANGEPTADQRRMLQSLLRDRFGLQCHFETKEGEVYFLTRGAKPLQFVAPKDPDAPPGATVIFKGTDKGMIEDGEARGHNTTIDYLASQFSRYLRLPVINQTGITGSWDFQLDPVDPDNQDIPTAVYSVVDRLGLKIKRGRGPVQTLVVDHIEKPTMDGVEASPGSDSPQSAEYVPTMTFDVASVRENKEADPSRGITMSGGFTQHTTHLRLTNLQIENILSDAFGTQGLWQVVGLPKWPYPTVFVIEAKGDSDADAKMASLPPEEQRMEQEHMLQVLLAERFKLKAHWETKEGDVLNLVVAKGGAKLGAEGTMPLSAQEQKNFSDRPVPPVYYKSDGGGADLVGHACPIADLVERLTSQFGRPLFDKTGLTGKYDFVVKYRGRWDSDRNVDDTDPMLPLDSAIREQLGLQVEKAKGPVQVLVIDHVERPSEN